MSERAEESPGSARLELVDGVVLLHPEDVVLEAMLSGWEKQQRGGRLLQPKTIRIVRRIAGFEANSTSPRSVISVRTTRVNWSPRASGSTRRRNPRGVRQHRVELIDLAEHNLGLVGAPRSRSTSRRSGPRLGMARSRCPCRDPHRPGVEAEVVMHYCLAHTWISHVSEW